MILFRLFIAIGCLGSLMIAYQGLSDSSWKVILGLFSFTIFVFSGAILQIAAKSA